MAFLHAKSDAHANFRRIYNKNQVKKECKIQKIKDDHGGEFENEEFAKYCDNREICHHFLTPKTPQQNEVAERRNKVIQEIIRTMMDERNLAQNLWVEDVNTACDLINRVYITKNTN